jgi:uncharacterized protein YjcR
MHGAAGGAPKGNRNAFKHGLYTAEAIEVRTIIRELRRQAWELVDLMSASLPGPTPLAKAA